LLVAAAVLVVTSLLINAQPAKQAFVPSYRAKVKAGPGVRVEAVIKPIRAGPTTIDVYTTDGAGSRLAVPEIIARLSLPGGGVPGLAAKVNELPARMQPAGPGHVVSTGLVVPIPGKWRLDITVRTDAINEYYADPIMVRFR
jgi:copper transport protein